MKIMLILWFPVSRHTICWGGPLVPAGGFFLGAASNFNAFFLRRLRKTDLKAPIRSGSSSRFQNWSQRLDWGDIERVTAISVSFFELASKFEVLFYHGCKD